MRGDRLTEFPSGAVTFLFSDIEGSTRLVKTLRERYARVLAEHRQLVRAAISGHGGHEVDTQGDAFFAVFGEAKQAVLCALEVQRSLAAHDWPPGTRVRVRMGIHTGHSIPADGMYTGLAVHRAARICAAARGGQVLISQATQTLVEDEEGGRSRASRWRTWASTTSRTWTGRYACSSSPRRGWNRRMSGSPARTARMVRQPGPRRESTAGRPP